MTETSHHHDVLIAGAGPVGLLLACELRLGGCSVLVLERESDPRSPVKCAPLGLRGLSVPTIESFDRRGLLEDFRARMDTEAIVAAAPWMRQERRPGGHFAGIDFFQDQIDQSRWQYRLPQAPVPMAADLAGIEAVLTERVLAMGVAIRRGCPVSAISTDADGVTVHAGGHAVRGGWLVGCDGARSIVRKAAGFGFTGTEPEFTGYFAQIELADGSRLAPGHHDTATGTYIYETPGTIRMVEFDGGASHRVTPLTRDHVQAVLCRVSGSDVAVAALGLATTWTDRAYLATHYRRGRVLLAGDAAHIHSPLGGQGLNLGLGDAMNLGWKLARTVRGDAVPDLLDSYERERRPVAEKILDWSRAQVAIMRPSPAAQALRAVLRDLIATRDGATYFAERTWGVGLRYDLGDDHPLVGRSAPDFALPDGKRLNAHLRDGRPVLLDFDQSWRGLADRLAGWVCYVPAGSERRMDLSAMLVRPDGVVAWASGDGADGAAAADVLSRWRLALGKA
ncbi:FAD-dependent monooxygenase [Sphingomonas sp.]|uniref:FAD-dependent monooxygenase n=1 Tax=Sphingomonas sp. TaxID=28214 RepID=UPI0025E5C03A|nr:FAD-dependent monooxygenase [Sphingomonas sp.]